MNIFQRLSLVWLPLFFCLLFLPLTRVAAEPVVSADAAILIDASTGRVIWAKNAEAPYQPASMTKMMTCLLALHSLKMHELVPISAQAAATESSPLGLKAGDQLEADELMHGMMMASDNGAAVALAEKISGSVPAFVDKMNDEAAALGMTGTHFHNPNGLSDPLHYSTAHDMARLARQAMRERNFRSIVSQPQMLVKWSRPQVKFQLFQNTNELLKTYAGATGIKTGWTQAAGGCLAASARREGLELIAVVMHAPTEEQRFRDAQALLDYGFQHVHMVRGYAQANLSRQCWVSGASQGSTTVRAASDVNYPLIDDEDASHYAIRYDLPRVLQGPIKDGQVVGQLVVTYDGEEVGSIDLQADGVAPGRSLSGWLVGVFAPLLERL